MRFQNAADWFAGILLSFLIGSPIGCTSKKDSAAQPELQPTTTNSELRAELNRTLPIERDPSRRPLILSRPASDRFQWVLQTLLQGYRDTGRTNALWDKQVENVFEAYVEYSRVSTTNWPVLRTALTAALATGCDDPMIQYMRTRYSEESQTDAEVAIQLVRAHRAMVESQYHPVFKFFAGWRAAESARNADRSARNPQIDRTTMDLEDLARDTNAPIDEVFEAANNWLSMSRGKMWMDYVLGDLDPILRRTWNNTEQLFHLEGYAEIWRAWGERGGGWATTVSEKGWEGFAEHMSKAEDLLTKAWQLNSNRADTAYLMMQVELGQGRGRLRMETWFNRAMSLESNYFDAVTLMSFYLEPRWYGSEHEALGFARACVASDKWDGQVPLILVNVHHSLATYYKQGDSPAYWHRPEVWADVKSAYDKFFALNPDGVSWRHNYAKDAYDCGQYSVFLEQTRLFTSGTNFTFFGGREKFQEMIQKAAAASHGQN
jgi:hypothetical protein